jgi:hypothetical protein
MFSADSTSTAAHNVETAQVGPQLDPRQADEKLAIPLSTRINSSRNDDPACIEPLRV